MPYISIQKLFFYIFIGVLYTNCTFNNPPPSAAIPFDSVKVIMWDLYRADAYITNYVSKDSVAKAKQASIELYERVFRTHKVSKEDFYKSCAYYLDNPDKHKILLDSLLAFAQRKPDILNVKKDSLAPRDAIVSKKNKDSLLPKQVSPKAIELKKKDTINIKKDKPIIKKHKYNILNKRKKSKKYIST